MNKADAVESVISSKNGMQTRIEHLRRELHRHNHLYHVCFQPEITDEAYDTLFHELLELERLHPELNDPCSPTRRIGGVSETPGKFRHERRMLSLDNVFSADEAMSRLPDREWMMEPKIDGLSLKLFYEQGRLVRAVTRGDGMEGDDVTVNARTIRTIPLALPSPLDLEVTGEVYMLYEVFDALNAALEAEGDDLFANARNAAAGSLKLKDSGEVAKRRLSFVVHGTPNEIGVESQEQLIAHFRSLGFQTVLDLPVAESTDQTVAKVVRIENAKALAADIAAADALRRSLAMPTDGLVFKINSLSRQRELGEGTRSPNWAVAYKFPPERKRTKLVGVTLQVGRTGKITPVAELEPVVLGGTVVKRASLCNQDEIARLGVHVNDVVFVEKSAEIIPKVVGIAQKNHKDGHYRLPPMCPCCQQALEQPLGFVDTYCTNPNCQDQVFQRLKHATGKAALDIDGCGDVMVRVLMDNGVRTLSDLFRIDKVNGLKPAALEKFRTGRERAKSAALWRKIHALGIDGIGRGLSQDLCARFTRLEAMLDDFEATRAILGNVCSASFVDYLCRHADEIERLDALGFKFETPESQTGPLTGKVFVITGALLSGTRDFVIREIERAGGTVKSGVSAKVNFLVMGEEAGATKTNAAKRHGVQVITEEELYRKIGKPMPEPRELDPNHDY